MANKKNNVPHDSEQWKLRRNPALEAAIGERVVTVIGEPGPHDGRERSLTLALGVLEKINLVLDTWTKGRTP